MKKIFVLYMLLMISCGLQAQSYHFSQFFSTPLLTNPAHTGFIDGAYRVTSNFRSQGLSGGSTYFTGYVSADISPFKYSLSQGHKAGLGLYVMNDKSSGGALNTNSVGLSGAYHVGLDEYGDHTIGLGFQGTFHQRRLDYSKLTFENQYGPGGYDPSIPIGESLGNVNRDFFDVNAGLVYNAVLEDRSFFIGASFYNILRHKENSLPEEFKMPARFVVQAGAQFFIGEYGKAYASVTHMNQAKANTTTLGGALGIQLNDKAIKNEVNFGMWYRYKDAVIPYIGYYYDGFQVGLSWDQTVSSLKTAAQVRNGLELTLVYNGIDKKKLRTSIPWY